MDWHYSDNGAQAGPVPQTEFNSLVQSGKITGDTLVWREGMPNWTRYADLPAAEPVLSPGGGSLTATGETHACAECGQMFPDVDMISFGNAWVCAACKPRFVQKLKEGVAPVGTLRYAGFWIRFGAKFIDLIILEALSFCVGLAIGTTLHGQTATYAGVIGGLAGLAIGISYETGFIGRFGATPGKMALKLKVVRPDGAPLTYGRAFGRYFGASLSGMILCIGYMMAGWDEEKRALHDRICDTRVIRQ